MEQLNHEAPSVVKFAQIMDADNAMRPKAILQFTLDPDCPRLIRAAHGSDRKGQEFDGDFNPAGVQ
jgi:hypothetical protein